MFNDFHVFIQDFLDNFKDHLCMSYYDECRIPRIKKPDTVTSMGVNLAPFRKKIKEGHQVLVYYEAIDGRRPLGFEIRHEASVIIRIKPDEEIVVEKIREPKEIQLEHFPYMNGMCGPDSVYDFPSNAERFIMNS